ncbi:MAG: hypothetical protein ACXVO9_13910 [Bacteroidia bacterium]
MKTLATLISALYLSLSASAQIYWMPVKSDSSAINIEKNCGTHKRVSYQKTITETNIGIEHQEIIQREQTYTVTINYENGRRIYSTSVTTYTYWGTSNALTLTVIPSYTETVIPAGTSPTTISIITPTNYVPITYSTNISNPKRRSAFESLLFKRYTCPGIFYFSPSIFFGKSNRAVIVNSYNYKNTTFLNKTAYEETPINTILYSVKAGVRIFKNHVFYVEGMKNEQGYSILYDSINPLTGLNDAAFKASTDRFSAFAIGIGYSYNPYISNRHVNFAFEIAPYYTVQSTGDSLTLHNEKRFGIKTAAGISIKPNYRWDIKIMPTLLYDTSPLRSTDIKTRLYNYGVSVSVGFSLFRYTYL